MLKVLVLGAGGHAQVVVDILMRARDSGGRIEAIGYLDDDSGLLGHTLVGVPVLGKIADLECIDHDALIVAIGDNRIRQRNFEEVRRQGKRFAIARHPSAVIAPDVDIGPGAAICAGALVNLGSVIGANVVLNTGCLVDHHNLIGDHAHIAPGTNLGGNVQIGTGTFVGIGATVLPDCRIGSWSVVGAGAIVVNDIPDGVIAFGVPARVVRSVKMTEEQP